MSSEDESLNPSSSSADATVQKHGKLGFFLCWAVVFADIGTSVYYTPGILYGQVGKLAGFFVMMTMVVFILLTLKYAEVTTRYPQGGGVVTVAANALWPWAGALGGMFILVDYFLTAAISSLSGLTYFAVVVPPISPVVFLITLVMLACLGALNWWGISESALVSLAGALVAFLSDLAIVCLVFLRVPLHTILHLLPLMFSGKPLTGITLLTGFAGSFLAFSGLESISQLAPVMKPPRKRTVRLALLMVVLTVGITSPLLTIFATTLVDVSRVDPNQLISILGSQYGGPGLGVAVAVSASALLIFASNTAIIGCYHVCLALSRLHYFPPFIQRRNTWRGTPHYSIALATGIPILVLMLARLASSGSQSVLIVLGNMYAFGLLGAFSLTCLGLDIVRFRERRWARGQKRYQRHGGPEAPVSTPMFVLGVFTTAVVMLAWSTNLVFKPLATAFGVSVTFIGMLIAFWNRHRTEKQGRRLVLAHQISHPIPGSVLAMLPLTAEDQQAIIHAACAEAHHQIVVFLYRGLLPSGRHLARFEIIDPYLEDETAQQAFAEAEMAARERGVKGMYVYLLDDPEAVAQFWHLLQPRDTIFSARDDQTTRELAPDRVLRRPGTGSSITHYLKDWSSR